MLHARPSFHISHPPLPADRHLPFATSISTQVCELCISLYSPMMLDATARTSTSSSPHANLRCAICISDAFPMYMAFLLSVVYYCLYRILVSHPAVEVFSSTPSVLALETADAPSVWRRFALCSLGSDSEDLFLSFSDLRAASFCACLRASLSFRSFSFRSALDSNSCQSPSRFANL
jgi:hypothetical protein